MCGATCLWTVDPDMSTDPAQPVWSDESEYEDSDVDGDEWRDHSDWPDYEDSDVDWEEWRDHPDREYWQDWQDAWMSQDPRYLEQEIHCTDTPMLLLAKKKLKVKKIIETIHDYLNMERSDLRSTIPELRSSGQKLLEDYMNNFTSMEGSRRNYRSEHAGALRFMYQERDELVDSYNEMIRQSNIVLQDLNWYEEEISAEVTPMEAVDQLAAEMTQKLSPPTPHSACSLAPGTDLKVEYASQEPTNIAGCSPSGNTEKKTDTREILDIQPKIKEKCVSHEPRNTADYSPSEGGEKTSGTRESLGVQLATSPRKMDLGPSQ